MGPVVVDGYSRSLGSGIRSRIHRAGDHAYDGCPGVPGRGMSVAGGTVARDERRRVVAEPEDLHGEFEGVAPESADEREAAAERRGLGKGTLLGLGLAVALVLLGAAVLVWSNPFEGPPTQADNTAPVTTLPQESVHPTESLPLATATSVPAPTGTAPATSGTATASATEPPASGHTLALNRWNWIDAQRTISVGGFVDVVESGGICTLTVASGGHTLVASEPARPDVTTTVCVVNLTSPELASGDWQVTMTYDGPSGTATSETVTVTVP